MARMATATCETCGTIDTRDQMRKVPLTLRTSNWYGVSHGRRGFRENAGVRYSRRMVWVCRGCPAPRSEGGFLWTAFKALVAAGVLAAAWAYASHQHLSINVPGATGLHIGQHAAATGAGADGINATTTSASAAGETTATQAIAAPIASGHHHERTLATADDAPVVDWHADAIVATADKALDRGRATRWHHDGASGYVVPSAATTIDGRECRTMFATTDDGGRSPTTTMCRDEGGEWLER